MRGVLWLAVGLTALAGCGPSRYDVSGKVTYNGAVLDKPEGQVIFIGPNGEQAAATIGADGSYRAANVATGANKVVVYYPNPKLKKPKSTKLKPGEPMPPTEPAYLTPEKFGSAATTDLTLDVNGNKEYPVAITGPPIR